MIKEYEIGDDKKVSVIYNNGVAQVTKEVLEQVLIPSLQKAKKYEWHDLRKNPEDLPESYDQVIVAVKTKITIFHEVAWHIEGIFMHGTDKIKNVIKWKRIDDEEVEDD